MKKIKYTLAFLAAGVLCGCNLLDIQPQNAIIPKTVGDYQSIIVGGYPTVDYFTGMTYMTDDVYMNFGSKEQPITATANKAYFPYFTWADTHQQSTDVNDPAWGQFYKSIFCANTVIDELKEMTPAAADADLYDTVLGEAYALRAYSYFYLANMYADVYSAENLEKPCVPMPLTATDMSKFSKNNVREPIGKVWQQIVDDLETATTYLRGKTATSEHRFTFVSLQAFKARVYLFMEEWDKSIAAASDVISAKTLFDMNSLQSVIDATPRGNRYVFHNAYGFMETGYRNEVLLFAGGKANNNKFYYSTGQSKPDLAIYELCMRFQGEFTDAQVNTMDVVDYRSYIYCSFVDYIDTPDVDMSTGPTVYRMYSVQGSNLTYYIALKLSEAYVTRAEAHMRKSSPDKARAIADLNTLLKSRIRSSVFTPLKDSDFPATQSLIDRILEERRLETALDSGLRWFDLRRLGKPAISHYVTSNDEQPKTLNQGDLKYVMQIPVSEQIASPKMPLNPR